MRADADVEGVMRRKTSPFQLYSYLGGIFWWLRFLDESLAVTEGTMQSGELNLKLQIVRKSNLNFDAKICMKWKKR